MMPHFGAHELSRCVSMSSIGAISLPYWLGLMIGGPLPSALVGGWR